MEIESIDIEGETKNYTLYYKSPGEKGSQYRKTIIEHSDSIEDEMGYISERSDYNELMDLIWDLRLRGL